MEEIRRKTAELDKPAGFVLSGVLATRVNTS